MWQLSGSGLIVLMVITLRDQSLKLEDCTSAHCSLQTTKYQHKVIWSVHLIEVTCNIQYDITYISFWALTLLWSDAAHVVHVNLTLMPNDLNKTGRSKCTFCSSAYEFVNVKNLFTLVLVSVILVWAPKAVSNNHPCFSFLCSIIPFIYSGIKDN